MDDEIQKYLHKGNYGGGENIYGEINIEESKYGWEIRYG